MNSRRMNSRLVNTAADVIAAAMQQGRTLPAALAIALESAQLLQSPETAAETARLRARVAELERQLVVKDRPVDEDPICYALTAKAEAARSVHEKYPDSEHCQHDGEPWPCPTLTALGEAGDAR